MIDYDMSVDQDYQPRLKLAFLHCPQKVHKTISFSFLSLLPSSPQISPLPLCGRSRGEHWVGTEGLQGAVRAECCRSAVPWAGGGRGEGSACDGAEGLGAPVICVTALPCSRVSGNLSIMADLAWIISHEHWRQAHFQPLSNVSGLKDTTTSSALQFYDL